MSSVTHSTHTQRRISYSRVTLILVNLACWAALAMAAAVIFRSVV